MLTKLELAQRIFLTSYLQGTFQLRSGKISHEYFDKYRFESDPTLLKAIASYMKALLPSSIDFLAGLEMGGIPIATAISLETQIPCLFVRKKAKEYGTCQVAEGSSTDLLGKRLCIIEDVITTGGQVQLSSEDLSKKGAIVESVLCVIDRSQGKNVLTESGIPLKALFKMEELLQFQRN